MSTKHELKSFQAENIVRVAAAEWEPWIARKLELGSLPLFQGLAVVAVALAPSVAVIATGTYFNGAYDGLYYVDGSRRLDSGSSTGTGDGGGDDDSSKCTTNTIIAYGAAAVVFAIALAVFGRVLGSNRALVDMMKLNADMEKEKFLGLGSGVAKAAQGGAQDALKDAAASQAKAAVTGHLSEPLIEESAEEAAGSVEDKAKAYLESQLKSSKLYGIFDLGRFVVAEVAILVGLLGPLVLGCGNADIWSGVQMGVGVIGCAISLGIPLWCVLQMSRDKYGMYKFFPGSQSNKLYELCTGVKVRAVLPDRGEVSGKMRMNWITKYQLCACGASMGLGLIIKFIAAILLLFNVGGKSKSAPMAFATFGVCLISKLPECYMYVGLWFTFCADFYAFLFGLVPCCPCCMRKYDEDDKKELFSCGGCLSCFSTRSDPPVGKFNWPAVYIEKKFFSFYQWFYVFIDKPLAGFTWCKILPCICCSLYIITGFNWSAVAKEYEEAEAFEEKLRAGIGSPIERRSSEATINPPQGDVQKGDSGAFLAGGASNPIPNVIGNRV
jgi:hypothetical protein